MIFLESNTIDVLFPYKRHSFNNRSLLKLPKNVMGLIEQEKQEIRLKKRQILYHQNTTCQGVYMIVSGMVKNYSTAMDGKEYVSYLAKKDEIVGYHGVMSGEPHSCSVACLTDATFHLIPIQVFKKIMEQNTKLQGRFLKSLGHEFGVLSLNSRILAQHTVRERTALSLLKLEEFYSGASIELSRKDLSNLIGTSVESLIRVLHDFKEDGVIEVCGRAIKLKYHGRLMKISNLI